MVLVSEYCAQFFGCSPKTLRDRLNHPEDRERAVKELTGKKVQTTYKDRNGMHKTFFIDGITEKGAAFVPAYGRLRQPFNINVAAHFYARHRVKLHHPYIPCIVERFECGENRNYPMELLEIVKEQQPIGQWLGNLFKERDDICSSSSTVSDKTLVLRDEEDTGRDQCSQKSPEFYW